MKMKSSWIASVLVCFIAIFDGVLTLAGQEASYWTDYSLAHEAFPLARVALQASPMLFMALCIVWSQALFALGILLPSPASTLVISCFFVLHVWGLSSWMMKIVGGDWGYYVSAGLLVSLTALMVYLLKDER